MAEPGANQPVPHRGALNAEDCPYWPGPCRCGKCAHCENRKHTASHCGVIGAPDKPYGHVFVQRSGEVR